MEGPIPYLCTYYAHPLVVFRGEVILHRIPICKFLLHVKKLLHLAANWLQKLKMVKCIRRSLRLGIVIIAKKILLLESVSSFVIWYLCDHRGQNSKQINITKYVSIFLIYGANMLDKCVKSQKEILYIVLFCKIKLSKMASIKTNKIKKQTALC